MAEEKPEKKLSDPLLPAGEYSSKHYFGLACNTAAALTFGTISLLVKLVDLPLPLMLQLRSLFQWVLAIAVIAWRRHAREDIAAVLFAPRKMRVLMILRAFMFYGFLMLWWAALTTIPAGDAVAIVYCNPVLAAIFAKLLLGEPTNPAAPVCIVLATLGVLLIVQPPALFGGEPKSPEYFTGVCLAGGSAVLAGLLPLAVRRSAGVHWSTVEHVTAVLAAFVFTPAVLYAWLRDPATGAGTVTEKISELCGPGGPLLTWRGGVLQLAIAGISFFGLALQTVGYQNVESTAAAGVMTYLEVPYVFALQAVIFGEVADAVKVLGVVLVLTSGLATVFYKQICGLFQR